MKDLAIRMWNSNDKKMVYIDDLYFFEEESIHEFEDGGYFGGYTEPPMIASPYYDVDIRLYENDIVEVFFCGKSEGLGVVKLDSTRSWIVEKFGTWSEMYNFHGRYKYVKIGDIYSNPEIIPNYKKQLKEKAQAEERERELRCLEKLKEKYEK